MAICLSLASEVELYWDKMDKLLGGPTLKKAKSFLIKTTKFYLSFSKVGPLFNLWTNALNIAHCSLFIATDHRESA